MYIKCDNCGKKFGRSRSKVNKNGNNFCSKKCRDQYFGNGKTRDEKKQEIVEYLKTNSPASNREISNKTDLEVHDQMIRKYTRDLREKNEWIDYKKYKGAYIYYHKQAENINKRLSNKLDEETVLFER